MARSPRGFGLVTRLAACAVLAGCSAGDAPSLSSKASDLEVPAENGPRLGSLALTTPVLDRPSREGAQIGALHAGATVARAVKPVGHDGCPGGWFPVRPRGVVCADEGVTLDGHAPALALVRAPDLAAAMPYPYGRTVRKSALLALTPQGARPAGELLVRTSIAVAGATRVNDAGGKPHALAMTTEGSFVDAVDLEQLREPGFRGVELGASRSLPVGFVIRENVETVKIDAGHVEKSATLQRLSMVGLTGKSHTRGPERYWATDDGSYVRHRDVTVVARRDTWPDFVRDDLRWVDVALVAGTAVLYEGRRPIFATLVSPGLDRNGGPRETRVGTFTVEAKHVTAVRPERPFDEARDVRDVPWVLELSSGQSMHAAYWHHRFGLPASAGHLQLSPADAARLFRWAEPALPPGWHSVRAPEAAPGAARTVVFVHR